MPKISITISGRVQGVFFRAYIKECADILDITGWVQNKKDGTVVLEAQHFSEDRLKDFIEQVQAGSSLSEIERAEVNWSEAEDEWEHFRILE